MMLNALIKCIMRCSCVLRLMSCYGGISMDMFTFINACISINAYLSVFLN
jgi:hypothetical protein